MDQDNKIEYPKFVYKFPLTLSFLNLSRETRDKFYPNLNDYPKLNCKVKDELEYYTQSLWFKTEFNFFIEEKLRRNDKIKKKYLDEYIHFDKCKIVNSKVRCNCGYIYCAKNKGANTWIISQFAR